MIINNISVTFIPRIVLENSRKGQPIGKFKYRAYKDNSILWALDCFKEYVFWRVKKVDLETKQLIITNKKPYEGSINWINEKMD